MINSKRKGKAGELQFAKYCGEHGFEARRGQQYNGLEGEDVVGLAGIHVEVKRTEFLKIHPAMEQSSNEADGKIPIVAHRKNGKEWLVTMKASDWFNFFRSFNKTGILNNAKLIKPKSKSRL